MHYSLGKQRMTEITENVVVGGYFPCHKTTPPRHSLEAEHGGWDNVPTIDKLAVIQKEQMCFGARNYKRTGAMLEDGIDPDA